VSIIDDVDAIKRRMEELSGKKATPAKPKVPSPTPAPSGKTLIASPGDIVTCEDGHAICTVAAPIYSDHLSLSQLVGGWCSMQSLNKPCHCGEPWWRKNTTKIQIHLHGKGWC
jgi:hypothetical protein